MASVTRRLISSGMPRSVAAQGDRHGTLGVWTQGEAGRPEQGALLLESAGIGEDAAGMLGQGKGIVVADGVDEFDARVAVEGEAEVFHAFAGARMNGKNDGPSSGDFA